MADTGPPWNLRFPGPQDFVRETNFYIEDLAEDTAAALSLAGNEGIGPNVVQTVKTDTFTTTSQTFTPVTGLEVTITPTSATSKVLILAQVAVGNELSVINAAAMFRLTGGNANTFIGDAEGSRTRGIWNMAARAGADYNFTADLRLYTVAYLDSPAVATPVTYGVECRSGPATSNAIYVNRSHFDDDNADRTVRGASSIIVIEVAA